MNIRLTAAALPQIDTTSLEELASTLRAAEERKSTAAQTPRPMPGPMAPVAPMATAAPVMTDAAPRDPATMPRILPPAVVESELAAPRARKPEPAPDPAVVRPPVAEAAAEPEPRAEPRAEPQAEQQAESTVVAEEAPAPPTLTLVGEAPEPTPAPAAVFQSPAQPVVEQDGTLETEDLGTDPSTLIESSVAEVAAAVITAMQASAEAHRRHLESIEQEAARRWEMLTAEAELDAELIRLNARREAHAIVAAARQRAGLDDDEAIDLPQEDEDPLSHISAMLSRFADLAEKQRGER